MKSLSLIMLLSSAPGPAFSAAETADLVFKHGTVITMAAAQPKAEVLAVKAGRVLAVGSSADMMRYIGKGTRVIDLKGMTAVPGFIEGHGHFMERGRTLTELDLTQAKTWDDIEAQVTAAVTKAQLGQWILGWGWH